MKNKKQMQIGQKNHNIDAYLKVAEMNYRFNGSNPPNKSFEKLNY
jgi:hypothetical protein